MVHTKSVSSNLKQDAFCLDYIYVWEVTTDSFRRYFLTMPSFNNVGDDEMVFVVGDKKVRPTILGYERAGGKFNVWGVDRLLKSKDEYNCALSDENYDFCFSILFNLEIELNHKYGYENKGAGKVKVVCDGRKGYK